MVVLIVRIIIFNKRRQSFFLLINLNGLIYILNAKYFMDTRTDYGVWKWNNNITVISLINLIFNITLRSRKHIIIIIN